MIYMIVPIEMAFSVYIYIYIDILKYFLVHYDLFTNNLTSKLRFQINSLLFKKLNKFFERYIIINEEFRNIKTIELFIEKYSQISVNMTRCSIICFEQQHSLLWGSSSPTIMEEQLVHKKLDLLTYKEHCSRPPV